MPTRKLGIRNLKKPTLNKVSLNKLIPNILTLINLCAGFSAIYYALFERWEHAVSMILIAAVLDGLDGRIARLMSATSRFGAELDSLADFLSFGIAPALLMYLYNLKNLGKWGWLTTLAFAVCGALRLARFNTLSIMAAEEKASLPSWAGRFFVGVPITIAAIVVLLPILIAFEMEIPLPSFLASGWVFLVSFLMVSRIPTFSFKTAHFSPKWVLPLFLGIGLMVTGLITSPWLTLICLGVAYLLSIPLSIKHHRKLSAPPSISAAHPSDLGQNNKK